MNYFNQYKKLIRKAQKRQLDREIYSEKHHVFPKSIFGENDFLVELTYKEHVIAHHLLYLICLRRYGSTHFRTIKMAHALNSFLRVKNKYENNRELIRLISKLKHKIRMTHTEETKKALSERFSGERNPNYGRTGDKHPLYGKKDTEETRRKKSESHKRRNYRGEQHHSHGKEPVNKGKKASKEAIERRKRTLNGRTCYKGIKRNFINIKTQQKEYNITASDLCRKYNLSNGNLSEVIKKVRNHTKGWMVLESSET